MRNPFKRHKKPELHVWMCPEQLCTHVIRSEGAPIDVVDKAMHLKQHLTVPTI